MLLLLLPLLLAGWVSQGAAQSDDQYCLAKDHYPYLYFGSKTAYERVYDHKDSPQNIPSCRPTALWVLTRSGTSYPDRDTLVRLHETLEPLRDQVWQNHEEPRMSPSNRRQRPQLRRPCTAQTLWLLARPGTRYPDPDMVATMQKILPGLKEQVVRNHNQRHSGTMCPEDLVALGRWTLNVTDDMAFVLTGQGQADLSFLARRLKRRFPEVLSAPYSPERFKFRFTDTQRTKESAEAFASGLFDRVEVEMPRAVQNDPLLQFYDNCPAWQSQVRDNQDAFEEVRKFEEMPETQQTLARVSRRLGFLHNLSMENVDLMWEMCRYDKAWRYIALSPWCAAFTEDDLKIMEYRADLQYYYAYSYGNDLNVRLGCPPVKDLLDHFSRLEALAGVPDGEVPAGAGPTPPNGVFYFTHDAALHMALARLGIAKDPLPLTAANYDQQTKRSFRTSLIGSFAGNLAAIFYQCSTGEKHRVMFYLREKIVEFEGCEVGLCSWTYIKNRLARSAQECDLGFCHGVSGSTPVLPALPAITSVLATMIAPLLARLLH